MIKSKIARIEKIVSALFATIAISTMLALYQQDSTLGDATTRAILSTAVYSMSFLTVILSIPLIQAKNITKKTFLTMAPVLIFAILNIFHSYVPTQIGWLTVILWCIFCILPDTCKKKTFIMFRNIWCVLCVIGIVCFVLYLFKIPLLQYNEVSYYTALASGSGRMSYIDYGVSLLYKQGDILRLCGLCNEPGYFGTFCALLFCANGATLKKKTNIILSIAGALSFSAAFSLIIVICCVVKLLSIIKNQKNIGKKTAYCLAAIAFAASYLFVLPNIETGNSSTDALIRRITVTSEGINGDNRSSVELDELYKATLSTSPLFGMGRGYVKENVKIAGLSYKTYIVEYGIIGCLMLWGALALAAIYRNSNNIKMVLLILVFFASIYQRPNIITIPYLIVLFGGIEYIKALYASKKTEGDL